MPRHLANSIPAAAAKLGVGPSTMRRIVTRGDVRFVTVNGLRRIPDSEIERLREVLGGDEMHAWQQLEERARQVEEKRLAAEERLLARRQRLRKELRELEKPSLKSKRRREFEPAPPPYRKARPTCQNGKEPSHEARKRTACKKTSAHPTSMPQPAMSRLAAFISAILIPPEGISPPQCVQQSGVNSHLLLRLSDHLAAPLAWRRRFFRKSSIRWSLHDFDHLS